MSPDAPAIDDFVNGCSAPAGVHAIATWWATCCASPELRDGVTPDAEDRADRRRLDRLHAQPRRRHPAPAGACRTTTFAQMDIDEERLRRRARRGRARSRRLDGPPRGARGRRLRRDVVPGRRLSPGDGRSTSRSRSATACARRSPTPSASAASCAGCARFPVLLDVCRDLEAVSPGALVLNYVNPMAMLCWAAAEASPIRMVGLCHSIQHTASELAADLGLPRRGARLSGGRYQPPRLLPAPRERGGADLYPALSRVTPPDLNRVRYEVLKHFGAFVTESSEHFAEYVPWFIKDGRPGPDRTLRHPARRVSAPLRAQHREWAALRDGARAGTDVGVERSAEYGAHIVRACETGEPFAFNGNVPNRAPAAGC